MKKTIIRCILSGCILLCGCGSNVNWDITDNAIEIEDTNLNEYVNPNDKEDTYIYVEINGAMYLPYGVQGEQITSDMIGECIAYEEDDDNQRYYKVNGSDDFIADYYVGGEMVQVNFMRKADTIGKDIETPNFIDDLGYDIWK